MSIKISLSHGGSIKVIHVLIFWLSFRYRLFQEWIREGSFKESQLFFAQEESIIDPIVDSQYPHNSCNIEFNPGWSFIGESQFVLPPESVR